MICSSLKRLPFIARLLSVDGLYLKLAEFSGCTPRGVNRLEEIADSLQVVVTSRPAAFANSPGFPERSFPHFELDSITRLLIDQYADKWVRAKDISARDRSDVKRILREKLNQPHLRDLARNPMQLTILPSLIN
jgi:hypothetical protein